MLSCLVIVSNIVLALLEMGRKKLTDLDKDLFDKICLETINNKLDVDFSKLMQAIDPIKSVKSRKIVGGPSSDTVRSTIMNKEKELEILTNQISSLRDFLEQAKEKLASFSNQ